MSNDQRKMFVVKKSPVEIVLRYVIKINNKKKLRTG